MFTIQEWDGKIYVCPSHAKVWEVPTAVGFLTNRTTKIEGLTLEEIRSAVAKFERRIQSRRPRVKRRAWISLAIDLGVRVWNDPARYNASCRCWYR